MTAFVLQLEDIGDKIDKLRIGHDGSGLGAGWHLNKVEVRKLSKKGKVRKLFWSKGIATGTLMALLLALYYLRISLRSMVGRRRRRRSY